MELVKIIDVNFLKLISGVIIGLILNIEKLVTLCPFKINLLIKIIVGLFYKDTQCGFKLFKGEQAREMFNRLILFGDSSKIVKYPKVTAFDVEVLVIAKNDGLKVKEIPVAWTYVPTKRVSAIRDSLLMLLEISKIRINDLLGKYKK